MANSIHIMTTDGDSEHDSSTDSKSEVEVGSSRGADNLELRERFESLPQELYNHIYIFTFTADSRIRIYGISRWARFYLTSLILPSTRARRIVTFNERPPSLLHVDRASRKKFADSYFGGEGSTFIFCPGFDTRFYLWAISRHRMLIKHVFWSSEAAHPGKVLQHSRYAEFQHRMWLERSLESFKFIAYSETEALVKKRAGIADEEYEE